MSIANVARVSPWPWWQQIVAFEFVFFLDDFFVGGEAASVLLFLDAGAFFLDPSSLDTSPSFSPLPTTFTAASVAAVGFVVETEH